MRNFFYLLLFVSVATFSACGDDDSAGAALTQENISGEWNLTMFSNDGSVSVSGFGSSPIESDISNSTVVIDFAADGTWTSMGQYDITVVSDTTTTDTYTDGIGSGTYTVENGRLSMTGIDSGDEADTETPTVLNVRNFVPDMIIELTGNNMASFTDPFFGLTVSTNFDTEMVLER